MLSYYEYTQLFLFLLYTLLSLIAIKSSTSSTVFHMLGHSREIYQVKHKYCAEVCRFCDVDNASDGRRGD